MSRAPGDAGKTPEIPKESVEEIEEIEGIWYFLWSFLSPKKSDKKLKDVAGWNIFALDPELGNLNQLAAFIDDVSGIPEASQS
jgi:hypothetical protein